MTRKRYVKLLMAKGWSRNSANEMAERVREQGGSYQQIGYVYTPSEFAEALNKAVNVVMQAATHIVKALAAGVAAFGEAVARELNTVDAE